MKKTSGADIWFKHVCADVFSFTVLEHSNLHTMAVVWGFSFIKELK